MMSVIILCHYDEILKSEEENHVYIEGVRWMVLIDGNVSFYQSRVGRHFSGSMSSAIKIIPLEM